MVIPLNQNGEIDSKYINLTVSDTDTPIVTHKQIK